MCVCRYSKCHFDLWTTLWIAVQIKSIPKSNKKKTIIYLLCFTKYNSVTSREKRPTIKSSVNLLFWTKFLRLRHARLSFGQFSLAPCEEPGRKVPRSTVQSRRNRIDLQWFRANKEQITTTTSTSTTYKIHPILKCVQTLRKNRRNKRRENCNGWGWFQGKFPASNFLGHKFRSHAGSQRDPYPKAKGSVGVGRLRLRVLLPQNGFKLCARQKKTGRLHSDHGKRAKGRACAEL